MKRLFGAKKAAAVPVAMSDVTERMDKRSSAYVPCHPLRSVVPEYDVCCIRDITQIARAWRN